MDEAPSDEPTREARQVSRSLSHALVSRAEEGGKRHILAQVVARGRESGRPVAHDRTAE
jgi:hypothetical protein